MALVGFPLAQFAMEDWGGRITVGAVLAFVLMAVWVVRRIRRRARWTLQAIDLLGASLARSVVVASHGDGEQPNLDLF